MSKRTSEWPSTYETIPGCSKPLCTLAENSNVKRRPDYRQIVVNGIHFVKIYEDFFFMIRIQYRLLRRLTPSLNTQTFLFVFDESWKKVTAYNTTRLSLLKWRWIYCVNVDEMLWS